MVFVLTLGGMTSINLCHCNCWLAKQFFAYYTAIISWNNTQHQTKHIGIIGCM